MKSYFLLLQCNPECFRTVDQMQGALETYLCIYRHPSGEQWLLGLVHGPVVCVVTTGSHTCVCVCMLKHVQLFCDPIDCSLPGSSVHGIFQATILEEVTISFSRGSSWPRDRTHVSCLAGRFFTTESWEALGVFPFQGYLCISTKGGGWGRGIKKTVRWQDYPRYCILSFVLYIVY